jgi:hypothetical protein
MIRPICVAIGIVGAFSPAHSQISAPPSRSTLPDVSSISPSNAAGVLKYCTSRGLVSSTSAGVALEGLTKRGDPTNANDLAAGVSGHILASKSYSIGSAPKFLQSQACDLVLKRAKQLG